MPSLKEKYMAQKKQNEVEIKDALDKRAKEIQETKCLRSDVAIMKEQQSTMLDRLALIEEMVQKLEKKQDHNKSEHEGFVAVYNEGQMELKDVLIDVESRLSKIEVQLAKYK